MTDHPELDAAIQRGLAIARDPQNAHITDPHTPRITTIYSPWYSEICLRCGHTLREDDQVLPHPNRPERYLHEDPATGFGCWSRLQGLPLLVTLAEDTPELAAVREQFLAGLHAHWTPEQANKRLDTLVVKRGDPWVLQICTICGHSVRVGDQVVRCPCGNPSCHGVFHQDITRHLTCWDTWGRTHYRQYCAFTGQLDQIPLEFPHG